MLILDKTNQTYDSNYMTHFVDRYNKDSIL